MIKKTKLTISGNAKKSIENIELAKSKSKNSVIIEKKTEKSFNKFRDKSFGSKKEDKTKSYKNDNNNFRKTFKTKVTPPITNDYEKRKLAEQRATKRIKNETALKDAKGKSTNKKRELKLTVSRALSDKIETRQRSLASLKRQRLKENKGLTKEEFQENLKPVKRDVNIPEVITVRELANRMAEQSTKVIKHLLQMGVTVTINQNLAADTAEYLVKEFGHNPIRETKAEEIIQKIKDSRAENLKNRPPIVTVMGHVDHGKTSLLDVLRSTNVVSGEYGGITQHIGAYQIESNSKKITFIDTPGHAAFSSMRARGANTTDIVVLVVAANDGIKPQTEEAINHARAAEVSIVVAINKIDINGADPEKVKGDLAAIDLTPEDWGGNIQMVPISALKGDGIDDLLERIALEAEILELKAHYDGAAQGVVIESELDKFRGSVATLLIQNGTLKLGDLVVSGNAMGKIKSIIDSNGNKIKEALPSAAVEVLGLNSVPSAGDQFQVVKNEKQAREISDYRTSKEKEKKLLKQKDESVGDLFETLGQETKKVLNVILKTDVGGTCEAINNALINLDSDKAKVKIVSSGVGGISESDANLALAVDAIILGFNVRAENTAKKIIESDSIPLSYHSIIYELLDDVKARMSGLLDPIIKEEIVGTAEVLEVFNSPKFGQVAGCSVLEGNVLRNKPVRVLRDDIVIFEGELNSLRRFKEDVNEVKNGNECGMGIKNYKDIKPGDKIEVFDRKEETQEI